MHFKPFTAYTIDIGMYMEGYIMSMINMLCRSTQFAVIACFNSD